MNKESLSPDQTHQKRIVFIEKAVGEGVLDRIPVSKRDQNIALVSILNDEITEEEVGKVFPGPTGKPLTKQRICQIRSRFLEEARGHVSPQLQSSHPLSELLARRLSPLNETDIRVRGMAERGDSPKEISLTVGKEALRSARGTFGRRGVAIPLTNIFYERLKTEVEAEADYEKLQKILDSLTIISLLYHLQRSNHDTKRVFASLTSVLRQGGFYLHGNLAIFAEKLKEKGIPVRRVTNASIKPVRARWIVFDKHEERIIDALKDDPDLQGSKENPVKQICGPTAPIPRTTEFRKRGHSGKYGSNIAEIIREITGYYTSGRNRRRVGDFLIGCPVPVFKHGHRYIYPLDMIEELKTFLKSNQEKI